VAPQDVDHAHAGTVSTLGIVGARPDADGLAVDIRTP
jgi:hypothetical protein